MSKLTDRLQVTGSTMILVAVNVVFAVINLAFSVWGSHNWLSLAAALICAAAAVAIFRMGRATWKVRQATKSLEAKLAGPRGKP